MKNENLEINIGFLGLVGGFFCCKTKSKKVKELKKLSKKIKKKKRKLKNKLKN